MNHGPIFVEDEIAKQDGWRYDKQGNRTGKWFYAYHRPGVALWRPKVEDISYLADLEDLRWRFVQHYKRQLKKWQKAFSAIDKAGGEAHAIPNNSADNHNEWWLFRISGKGSDKSIGFDWVKKPDEPICLEIGQAFYELDQYYNYSGNKRLYKVNAVFRMAMENYTKSNDFPKPKEGLTAQVKINGRIYWYRSAVSKVGYFWEELFWPERDVIKVFGGKISKKIGVVAKK